MSDKAQEPFPNVNKDTAPDVLYETFLALQGREMKLKEHLATALRAQKICEQQYEKEKEIREKIEQSFNLLSEKCEKVKTENYEDRKEMLGSFKDQSEKINEQISQVSKENETLITENNKYRERVIQLLEQKEKFIKDAGTWRDISQEMRKEMNRLRTENEDYNKKVNELTRGAISDKKLIQKSIQHETELRELLTKRADEFTDMYKKSLTQSKYICSLADDMKAMKKDLDKLKKKLKTAETDKLKAEQGVLLIAKEKLEGDANLARKDIKIATLEKLCRALQAKMSLNKLGGIKEEINEKLQNAKQEQQQADKEKENAEPQPQEVAAEVKDEEA